MNAKDPTATGEATGESLEEHRGDESLEVASPIVATSWNICQLVTSQTCLSNPSPV